MPLFLLSFLKKFLMAALGERVLAKAMFGVATLLAAQTETKIDDEVVAEWKKSYYGTEEDTVTDGKS